jgi:hypothetical protein
VTLRDEQLWFAGAVMAGEALDEADRRLTPGPKLGARERLDVYRHGYEARLVECLADDYPVLKTALGDEAFDALARRYIARFPSVAPNLNAYGRRMADVCEGFPAELARLEWAIVEVIHEPSRPPMTMESLGAIPEDAWGTARLVASPALRLLSLSHPANDYFQAVRDGHSPAIPAPAASATVVYRSGTTVWRMGLTPPMHRVLAALVAGEPLEASLSLAEGVPPEELTRWFREWVSSGLFVAVETG